METSRATPEQRRILIIDEHPLIRRGLIALIDNEIDLSVCGTAATHREGFESIVVCRPDLVIAEFSKQDADDFRLLRDIRLNYPDLPVLVFSMHNTSQFIRRALDAGANGYISKQEIGETLLFALRRILKGETYLGMEIGAGSEAE